MKKWNKKVGPERYLATWPNGPAAELARQILGVKAQPIDSLVDTRDRTGYRSDDVEPVRFFSPASNGLSVIVAPKEWVVNKTPAGDRTIQTPGKTAQFENNIYITSDPEIIEFLTTTYTDKRYPIVRDDMKTASAHTYS